MLPFIFSACAEIGAGSALPTSPATAGQTYAKAPEWVTRGCRAYWSNPLHREAVVCANGAAAASRNPLTTRETAIARARTALARNVEVTIESFARLEEHEDGDGELRSIIHQLTSASLPGAQVEEIWRSESGEVHALVSLHIAEVQHSVRSAAPLEESE